MDGNGWSVDEALRRLDEVAPGAPLLALGQTALWDEPMKAGLALALQRSSSARRFVAGVHDTDYFAKLPEGPREPGRFRALPHNATTTRALWSAAGEFSALFGSETVITRQDFAGAGLMVEKISRSRPGILDGASEAFGWRGIVALDESPPVVAELPLDAVLSELEATLRWAVDETLACVVEAEAGRAKVQAERLVGMVAEQARRSGQTLADLYASLIPKVYAFVSGDALVNISTTRTTELLRFNVSTCSLPRFDLVQMFLDPETSRSARVAYDRAVEGTEIYALDRFGSGAAPFDLYIPGKGRGTLRIGRRGIVVMSHEPQFVSLRSPVTDVHELAEVVERHFGPDCVLVGKAVALIGQLAREFVFVFHEGASPYVKQSRDFLKHLRTGGIEVPCHPILRVRYETWGALTGCDVWLKLPEPLESTFGAGEICAPSFAARWPEVRREQEELLGALGEMRRPIDFIGFLGSRAGGSWNSLAAEYEGIHERLIEVASQVRGLKEARITLYGELRELRAARTSAEQAKGEHFRAAIFEKKPSAAELEKRRGFELKLEGIAARAREIRDELRSSVRRQSEIVGSPELAALHERRRGIELEAELKRLAIVRNAVISSRGLVRAARRPSAWWFPIVCPGGGWFRSTVESASCYFEPLGPEEGPRRSVKAVARSRDSTSSNS